jgi:hypothetical protein
LTAKTQDAKKERREFALCNKLAAARHKDLDDIEHLPER